MKSTNLKRVLASLLVLLMVTALFVGCSSDPEPVPTPAPAQTDAPGEENEPADGEDAGTTLTEPVVLTFSTQDVGGAMYVYASALANIWSQVLPEGSRIDVMTTSPGGVGAPIVIQNGDADITLGNAAPAKWAAEDGILGFPPTDDVRAIAGGLGVDFVNIMFTQSFVERTGITTLEELVAQEHPVRLVVPPPGSFGELSAYHVLGVLGVNYEMIESWGGSADLLSWDAIVTLLRDDRADIVISHIGAGQPATSELTMTTDMFFPQLADSTLDALAEVGFAPIEIAAGTWSGQDVAIQSVGSQQVILVSASLPDELIYVLVRAISTSEGRAELVHAHAALAAFDPALAFDPLLLGAPIHPGAEAAFRAMGYMQ